MLKALVALLLLATASYGQCWGQRSTTVSGSVGSAGSVGSVGSEWKSNNENGNVCFELWNGNNYLGFYDATNSCYRAYLGRDGNGNDVYGHKDKAPITPPEVIPAKIESWQKNGVNTDRISAGDESYSVNGKAVSFKQVVKALDDDSGKMWLTVIGDKATRDSLIKSLPDELISRCRVWSVVKDHPSLLDRETGKTMFPGGPLYLQDSKGVVLYHGGSVDALRKADPLYKPDAPIKPGTPADVPLPLVPIIAVIAGATIFSLTRGKKQ